MTKLNFEGRVAIVTGAGRGMGRNHAKTLAARGASVVANDAGVEVDGTGWSAEPAESIVEEIRAAGGEAVANTENVRESKAGTDLVAQALDTYGRLDIVVTNAGILRVNDFADATDDDLAYQIDSHIYGTYYTLRAAWPHFQAAGYGRIVTVPTISLFAAPQLTGYNVAKGGILGLTRTLAREGESFGIRVNGLAPAAWTRMSESAANIDSALAYEFAKRAMPAQANAAVMAYLAHESVRVNGEVLMNSGSRVSRLLYADTEGLEYDVDVELTPEYIAENLDQIADATKFHEWQTADDMIQYTQAKLRASDAAK